MSLLDELREALGEPDAPSFRLSGDDLALLGARRGGAERGRLAREAHDWLVRHDVSLSRRIDGYLALGRKCDFAYPWPVVAILGLCQVRSGLTRVYAFGLAGAVLRRLGRPALDELADRSNDVLRRTNRGIFTDSVPTVLWALAAHQARLEGRDSEALALLAPPWPPLVDEESAAIAHALYDGLGIPSPRERFSTLARLTARHFAREQAIYTHQMGPRSPGRVRRSGGLLAHLLVPSTVSAPRVLSTPRGRRLVFRPFALPAAFDLRDHDARVEAFGRAFVTSVTSSLDDYRVAVRWVVERFGEPGEVPRVAYPDGI